MHAASNSEPHSRARLHRLPLASAAPRVPHGPMAGAPGGSETQQQPSSPPRSRLICLPLNPSALLVPWRAPTPSLPPTVGFPWTFTPFPVLHPAALRTLQAAPAASHLPFPNHF